MVDANIIKFPEIKLATEDFEVEFDMELEAVGNQKEEIRNGLNYIDAQLISIHRRVDELNKEIDGLTNHSDGIDYIIAVSSGILAGIIDSFWVGKFDFENGKDWGNDKVNNFVVKMAQTQGYEGDNLEGAIRYLESGKKHGNSGIRSGFGAPSDSTTNELGGPLQHHLRDFAHHPTPMGLMFSLLTQFTEKAYGTDTNGHFIVVNIKDKAYIGKDIPQKLLFGSVFWFLHLVSDMAGSNKYHGAGTGLPGPLLSLAKELSVLPFFKNIHIGENTFSEWLSKLFNGTLLGEHNSEGKVIDKVRFDLRAELGVAHELGRQAIPVIINECIVRGFYFIRRLGMEIKEKGIRELGELGRVDWDKVKPTKNRTIVRMLTIATGTFTMIDLGDAAIRGGIESMKSAGNLSMFAKEFVLRVNFVGVGRFAIAVGTDVSMGIKNDKLRNERMALHSKQLHFMNAKIYYMQADSWVAAQTTERTLNETAEVMKRATIFTIETWKANRESMNNIGTYRQGIEKHNPGLIKDIHSVLKWGL